MSILVDFVYLATLLILSPLLLWKAATTGKYRRGLVAKLLGSAFLRDGDLPCVWFHGVSVGEIHLLRQVVANFRRRYPAWQCVVSTTTDTGYEEARKCFPDLPVFYWPLDFSWAVRRAFRRVRPQLVVLGECELWPNFLRAAEQVEVSVAVINARISPRSLVRYRRLGRLAGSLFRRIGVWGAQTEEYATHLRHLGVAPERVHVTGNVKYDGVATDRHNRRTEELRHLLGVQPDELVWVAGSTQAPEEQVVLEIFLRTRERFPTLRLILVPRQKERFVEVQRLLESRQVPHQCRSRLTDAAPEPVILVDTIGELGAIWGLADVAFVGGSLDGRRGGQNMLEPAGYGAAVLFGPHVWNFKDAAARLIACGGAIQIMDAAGLEREVARLLGSADEREQLGRAAQQFIQSQRGATERTLDLLDALLPAERTRRAAA